MRLGKDKRICHMCMAGLDDLPWEDVSNRASWQSTLYEERPWDAENVSALLSIPYDASKPEALFKNDPFYVVKYGIGRHFTASCLVTLIFLDIFPGELNNVEVRLERAYTDFRSARRQLKSSPNVKGFTRETLHLKHNDSFPCSPSRSGFRATPLHREPAVGSSECGRGGIHYPKGQCTQIVYTLAPMYLYRDHVKANVYTI